MSDSFDNVSIVKQANVYFDGLVSSRTIKFDDGSTKTLGFMMKGEFEFGTDKPELMEVIGGEMEVMLPGENSWQTCSAGTSFNVPGSSKFQVRVGKMADYICSFID